MIVVPASEDRCMKWATRPGTRQVLRECELLPMSPPVTFSCLKDSGDECAFLDLMAAATNTHNSRVHLRKPSWQAVDKGRDGNPSPRPLSKATEVTPVPPSLISHTRRLGDVEAAVIRRKLSLDFSLDSSHNDELFPGRSSEGLSSLFSFSRGLLLILPSPNSRWSYLAWVVVIWASAIAFLSFFFNVSHLAYFKHVYGRVLRHHPSR